MLYISNIQQFIKENPVDKLTLQRAEQIYDKIVDDLNTHNYLYYVKSQPIISDYEYDLLFHYLEDLEKKFPSLVKPYSPTQRLTNQVQEELKKASHKYPLLSLENTYNLEEVEEKLDKVIDEIRKSNIIADNNRVEIGKLKVESSPDFGGIPQGDDSLGININTKSPKSPQNLQISFYVEPKYDGLSIELIYENGVFKQAITRGDGYIGEDVTENAKTIRTLPLKIPYKGKLHIRGEVVIKKSEFEKVNAEREKEGLTTYSNPRNLASGSLRQLDPSITAERNLDVVVYEVLNIGDVEINGDLGDEKNKSPKSPSNPQISYHHEVLDFLEEQGFFVYDFKRILEGVRLENQMSSDEKALDIQKFYSRFHPRKGLTKEQVLEIVKSQEIKEILDQQDIEFDGLVIKVDNIKYWPLLGSTSHHPKWAFAFKYPAKQVSSQILNAELSVGRTGIITPVALLEPVEVGGVIVKRATLHNFDFIKEKDIHVNDYVWVIRSGEVIPYIESVIRTDNTKHPVDLSLQEKILKQLNQQFQEKYDLDEVKGPEYLDYLLKYKFYENQQLIYKIKSPKGGEIYIVKIIEPPYCPVCGGETFHPEGEVALRCVNVACPAQVKEKIVHFVSKQGLDIEGLSEKTIETFLKAGLIHDYGDIFYLPEKREQILALPGFQQKKVENIIKAILEKTEISLDKFLSALGIEFVGKKTAKLIMDALREIIDKDLILEKKDGKIYIDFRRLMDFFASEKGYEFLLSINGIGPKVAESVRKFFHEEHNRQVIEKILKKVRIYIPVKSKGKFSGQQIVITGSVEGISRDQIAEFIQANQGEFSNQVTQHTTLLLVGDKPGKSKLEKAQKYGIPTYDLKKFLEENGFDVKFIPKQESLF